MHRSLSQELLDRWPDECAVLHLCAAPEAVLAMPRVVEWLRAAGHPLREVSVEAFCARVQQVGAGKGMEGLRKRLWRRIAGGKLSQSSKKNQNSGRVEKEIAFSHTHGASGGVFVPDPGR